jgi:hypothetical protein
MGLTDLWLSSKEQGEGKHVKQVIAVAGDGRLGSIMGAIMGTVMF